MEFPYPHRKHQREIIEDISWAAENGGHIVLEAGLGSGKTVCALCPTLSHALANDKKVVYITRTNSQQRQVIVELRALKARGMGIQGRHNLCPSFKEDAELRVGTPDELSKLCIDRKNRVIAGDHGACPYYYNTLKVDEGSVRKKLEGVPTVEEFSTYCKGRRLCAYELTKQFLGEAPLVVAPYVFFLRPVIRRSLLGWMGAGVGDVMLVVDEAHNLADYLRELLTVELSTASLALAEREALEFGNHEVLERFTVVDVCQLLADAAGRLSEEHLREDDALLPGTVLEDELLTDVGTSGRLSSLTKNLLMFGEAIRELKRKSNRLPRSHIYHLGAFLNSWTGSDDETHVKLIMDKKNPTLQLYCLDPREAAAVIRDCHCSVHMSGTLRPLEEYRDTLGLPEGTLLRTYPSPFPPGNKALYFADDVTTRFEDFRKAGNIERLKDWLVSISEIRRNAAFFFPSYETMREFMALRGKLGKKVFVESKGLGQEELATTLRKFKGSRNSVIFGVIGGRIGEGVDFPDEELEVVVLVGIPYPKPTARQKAQILYYDLRFNKGWDYAVKAPTVRKMNQALGRLIRRETDRGIGIVLDRRAAGLRDELGKMKRLERPVSELESLLTPR